MFQSFLYPKPFGLEVSNTSLKISKRPAVLINQNITKDKLSALKEILTKYKLKTSYVSISVPEKHSFSHLISKNEDQGSLTKNITANIPMPIEKLCYSAKATKAGLFIAAASKKIVEEQIVSLDEAELIVTSIEPESTAIARVLYPESGWRLIIKIAPEGMVFIICSKEAIYFTAFKEKSEEFNIQSLTEASLDYLAFFENRKDQKINDIVLCGDEAETHNICEALEEKTRLRTTLAKNPQFVVAIGLEMRNYKINEWRQ